MLPVPRIEARWRFRPPFAPRLYVNKTSLVGPPDNLGQVSFSEIASLESNAVEICHVELATRKVRIPDDSPSTDRYIRDVGLPQVEGTCTERS